MLDSDRRSEIKSKIDYESKDPKLTVILFVATEYEYFLIKVHTRSALVESW